MLLVQMSGLGLAAPARRLGIKIVDTELAAPETVAVAALPRFALLRQPPLTNARLRRPRP